MPTLRKLLAATDFSAAARPAVQRALMLAREHDCGLDLLHVLDRSAVDALRAFFQLGEDATGHLQADALTSLEALLGELQVEAERLVGCRVALGTISTEIAQAAARADLLVIGARGQNPLCDMLLGSTAERLLRLSPVPLLVTRSADERPYRRVLAALDLSPHSATTLAWARDLAPSAELLLVHGFDLPYAGKLWVAGVSEQQITHFRDSARWQAHSQLDALLDGAGLADVPVRRVVEQAHVPRLILDQCAEFGADLLVLGRRQRSSVEEALLGSVTRHVLADAPCDVLVVQDGPAP